MGPRNQSGKLWIGVAYILVVFLFEIVHARRESDDKVWVIVGDLPSAYIMPEDSPNPATALDSYIGAMEQWVAAAKIGGNVEELIPVNVPATRKMAKVESRLRFLDKEISRTTRTTWRTNNEQPIAMCNWMSSPNARSVATLWLCSRKRRV